MAESINITLSQQTTTLKQSFHKFDTNLQEMFEYLEKSLDSIDTDMSLSSQFDIVISAEYLLVKIRAKVLTELARVQSVISSPTTGSTLDKMFKDRYNSIILMCQRINELRDDISTIQRSMYARNMGRL